MMSIGYLISMAEKRLAQLETARRNSEESGDLDNVLSINDQILETQDTLNKLRSLT